MVVVAVRRFRNKILNIILEKIGRPKQKVKGLKKFGRPKQKVKPGRAK